MLRPFPHHWQSATIPADCANVGRVVFNWRLEEDYAWYSPSTLLRYARLSDNREHVHRLDTYSYIGNECVRHRHPSCSLQPAAHSLQTELGYYEKLGWTFSLID
ncbi:hypothetical protein E2C01_004153 [Portunus trituberculatus]|uniref:Uncharacterized protein n=1 Tax=Portunus trituberculatus TaxID=210409 RepID=A0A5B7CT91_PORTR|nr:hypothetical protein [Portunus trituberculatus]